MELIEAIETAGAQFISIEKYAGARGFLVRFKVGQTEISGEGRTLRDAGLSALQVLVGLVKEISQN